MDFAGGANFGNISYYYYPGLDESTDGKAKQYDITARIADNLGLSDALTWRFYYDPNAPVISSITPANNAIITDVRPQINVGFNEKISRINVRVENGAIEYPYYQIENIGNQTFRFKNDAAQLSGTSTIRMTVEDNANNSVEFASVFHVDTDYPTLTLDKIQITNSTKISLGGTYADMYVSKIELLSPVSRSINYGFGAPSLGTFEFTDVPLTTNGNNFVRVKITDMVGRTYNDSFNLTQDSIPPSLSLQVPSLTNMQNVGISGSTDASRLELYVDDAYSSSLVVANGQFSANVLLTGDGLHTIKAIAYDAAGNSRTESRNVMLDSAVPIIDAIEPADGDVRREAASINAYAHDESGGSGLNFARSTIELSRAGTSIPGITSNDGKNKISFLPGVGLTDGDYTIIVKVYDNAGNFIQSQSGFKIDSNAPLIILSTPSEALIYTNISSFQITGSMQAAPGKTLVEKKIFLNNIAQDVSESFSIFLSLSEGDNTIRAFAKDNAGSTAALTSYIRLDTQAPTISIQNRNLLTSQSSIAIFGSFNDNYDLAADAIVVRNIDNGDNQFALMASDKSYSGSISLIEET